MSEYDAGRSWIAHYVPALGDGKSLPALWELLTPEERQAAMNDYSTRLVNDIERKCMQGVAFPGGACASSNTTGAANCSTYPLSKLILGGW